MIEHEGDGEENDGDESDDCDDGGDDIDEDADDENVWWIYKAFSMCSIIPNCLFLCHAPLICEHSSLQI